MGFSKIASCRQSESSPNYGLSNLRVKDSVFEGTQFECLDSADDVETQGRVTYVAARRTCLSAILVKQRIKSASKYGAPVNSQRESRLVDANLELGLQPRNHFLTLS